MPPKFKQKTNDEGFFYFIHPHIHTNKIIQIIKQNSQFLFSKFLFPNKCAPPHNNVLFYSRMDSDAPLYICYAARPNLKHLVTQMVLYREASLYCRRQKLKISFYFSTFPPSECTLDFFQLFFPLPIQNDILTFFDFFFE